MLPYALNFRWIGSISDADADAWSDVHVCSSYEDQTLRDELGPLTHNPAHGVTSTYVSC